MTYRSPTLDTEATSVRLHPQHGILAARRRVRERLPTTAPRQAVTTAPNENLPREKKA